MDAKVVILIFAIAVALATCIGSNDYLNREEMSSCLKHNSLEACTQFLGK